MILTSSKFPLLPHNMNFNPLLFNDFFTFFYTRDQLYPLFFFHYFSYLERVALSCIVVPIGSSDVNVCDADVRTRALLASILQPLDLLYSKDGKRTTETVRFLQTTPAPYCTA